MRTKVLVGILLVFGLVAMGGCAAGPNTLQDTHGDEGEIAGFWQGLWHGIIVPVTWVISLFSETVGIYEVHNNGGWYDTGFLLGAGMFLGGGSGGAACRRRRKCSE